MHGKGYAEPKNNRIRVNFTMPEDLYRKLVDLSDSQDRSMASFMRHLILEESRKYAA